VLLRKRGVARPTAPIEASVQHRTAKVILVGDTGVGKSGLAHRLVLGKFTDTRSSHARRALVLDSSTVKTAAGVDEHRETVLWDLAGQPAYRLVHQLAMDDAAVACVLLDARSETNSLEGGPIGRRRSTRFAPMRPSPSAWCQRGWMSAACP
jgi:GTPase SAR1 family protein